LPEGPDSRPHMARTGLGSRTRRDDQGHPLEVKARPEREEVGGQLGHRFGNLDRFHTAS